MTVEQPLTQCLVPPGIPPRPKGPRVFLDYDQQELDWAYDQAPWAPNAADIAKRNAQKSAFALGRLGVPKRFAYGQKEIEQLDCYTTKRPNAPVIVFIHGGAWRVGEARAAAYMAETYVDAGAVFVALDFNNVLEAEGDLTVLADQVRRGVAWVRKNASGFGGDPEAIYVCGTSSGAHLAGVVLTTDWQNDFALPADTVKGGLLASGMYDLYPVSLSARSNYVSFTPQTIECLSPLRHVDKLSAPVIVAHGTLESPEFQRQNREFARALEKIGKLASLVVGQGYNHFEMFETLGNPYGLLGRAMLKMMEVDRRPWGTR